MCKDLENGCSRRSCGQSWEAMRRLSFPVMFRYGFRWSELMVSRLRGFSHMLSRTFPVFAGVHRLLPRFQNSSSLGLELVGDFVKLLVRLVSIPVRMVFLFRFSFSFKF